MAIDDYLNHREKSGWKKARPSVEISKATIIRACIIIAIVGLLVGSIVLFVVGVGKNGTQDMGWYGETTATIIKCEYETDEEGYSGYAYTFEYEVDGQKYKGREYQNRLGNKERKLMEIDIVYNENNPAEFVVESSDATTIYFQKSELSIMLLIVVLMIPVAIFGEGTRRGKIGRIMDDL